MDWQADEQDKHKYGRVATLYHIFKIKKIMNKRLNAFPQVLRLNSAIDDAAGASIVNRMTSQIKGLEAAIRNAAIYFPSRLLRAIEEVTQILHNA